MTEDIIECIFEYLQHVDIVSFRYICKEARNNSDTPYYKNLVLDLNNEYHRDKLLNYNPMNKLYLIEKIRNVKSIEQLKNLVKNHKFKILLEICFKSLFSTLLY